VVGEQSEGDRRDGGLKLGWAKPLPPTTATVLLGFTLAASAANQPVPKTSEAATGSAGSGRPSGRPGWPCRPRMGRAASAPVRC
jgi:hypothetical protein